MREINKNKLLIFSVFVLLLLSFMPICFAFGNDTILDESTDILGEVNYYFNSSANDDGDGSLTNPYNTLTNDKLANNSIIHLTDGEYELNKGKTLYNISIIGQSTQNTIIKFQNNNKFYQKVNIKGHLFIFMSKDTCSFLCLKKS